MSHYTPTNDQIQALLRFASAKFGVTPEQLLTAVQNGQLSGIGSSLSPADAQKLQSLLQNNDQVAKLMQSPAVQQYIQNFFHQNR